MSVSVLVEDDDPTPRAPALRLLVASGLTVLGKAGGVVGPSSAVELTPAAARFGGD